MELEHFQMESEEQNDLNEAISLKYNQNVVGESINQFIIIIYYIINIDNDTFSKIQITEII